MSTLTPRDRALFARHGIQETADPAPSADPVVRLHTERQTQLNRPALGARIIARIKQAAGIKPDGR